MSRPIGRIRNFQGMSITPQWCFWKGPETGIDHPHWAGSYGSKAEAEAACRRHGITPLAPRPRDPNLPR